MTHLHTPSARVSGLFSELYIGLMSGTSLDGVDGVLMHHEDGQWRTLAHAHRPFPPALRQALLDLNTPGEDELHRSALAAQALAVVYATVVEAVCQQAQVPPAEVQAIGAHGQTVRHRPDQGYTLQLNQPALLAELTGIDVIADFRSRDVAAGGQGAPLVPAFHQAPPKSTGRDLFNAEWLTRWLAPHGLTDGPQADAALARDVQATLCELTARSAALALREHAADASDVVVCGGGALNGDLMRRLGEQLPGVRVGRSDAHGLDVMQVEAAAFAWLAWTHLQRLAGNVPAVTGARAPRVLGALYPAR